MTLSVEMVMCKETSSVMMASSSSITLPMAAMGATSTAAYNLAGTAYLVMSTTSEESLLATESSIDPL